MKLSNKKPQKPQVESVASETKGIPSGAPSGIKNENTNIAKAQKIYEAGYSKRELSTLQRLPAQELDFILREKRDPEPNEISRKTVESSREVVRAYIESLETIKQARANESLNKGLVTLAQSNATALSEMVGTNTGGRVGLAILLVASIALAIDSIVGFDRLKNLFAKKGKESKKEDGEK